MNDTHDPAPHPEGLVYEDLSLADQPATHVLLVGVGRFDDKGLAPLDSPPASARAMASWFLNATTGRPGFANPDRPLGSLALLLSETASPAGSEVGAVPEATFANVQTALRAWITRAGRNPGSAAVLFVASHGQADFRRTAILLQDYGSDPLDPFAGMTEVEQLARALTTLDPADMLLIFDCCRTPVSLNLADDTSFGKPLIGGRVPPAGFVGVRPTILRSTRLGAAAYGGGGLGTTLFTGALLEALSGLAASPSDDWRIYSSDLSATAEEILALWREDGEALQIPAFETEGKVPISQIDEPAVVPVFLGLPPDHDIANTRFRLYRQDATEPDADVPGPTDGTPYVRFGLQELVPYRITAHESGGELIGEMTVKTRMPRLIKTLPVGGTAAGGLQVIRAKSAGPETAGGALQVTVEPTQGQPQAPVIRAARVGRVPEFDLPMAAPPADLGMPRERPALGPRSPMPEPLPDAWIAPERPAPEPSAPRAAPPPPVVGSPGPSAGEGIYLDMPPDSPAEEPVVWPHDITGTHGTPVLVRGHLEPLVVPPNGSGVRLDPGQWVIRASRPGAPDVETVVEVEDGDEVTLDLPGLQTGHEWLAPAVMAGVIGVRERGPDASIAATPSPAVLLQGADGRPLTDVLVQQAHSDGRFAVFRCADTAGERFPRGQTAPSCTPVWADYRGPGWRERCFVPVQGALASFGVPRPDGTPDPWQVEVLVDETPPADRSHVAGYAVSGRFGSLLAFLARRAFLDAGAALHSLVADIPLRDAVMEKAANPLAALAAAQIAVANGRPDAFGIPDQWLENLAKWFPTLPDGPVILGRLLQRRGLPAGDHFAEAERRGVPVFSLTLDWLSEGLEMTGHPGAEAARARSLRTDPTRAFTVFRLTDKDR